MAGREGRREVRQACIERITMLHRSIDLAFIGFMFLLVRDPSLRRLNGRGGFAQGMLGADLAVRVFLECASSDDHVQRIDAQQFTGESSVDAGKQLECFSGLYAAYYSCQWREHTCGAAA